VCLQYKIESKTLNSCGPSSGVPGAAGSENCKANVSPYLCIPKFAGQTRQHVVVWTPLYPLIIYMMEKEHYEYYLCTMPKHSSRNFSLFLDY